MLTESFFCCFPATTRSLINVATRSLINVATRKANFRVIIYENTASSF